MEQCNNSGRPNFIAGKRKGSARLSPIQEGGCRSVMMDCRLFVLF